MDKEQLNFLVKKASDLWQSHQYDEANEYFEKAYPHLDRNYWRATDFLNSYGLNLEAQGKYEQASKALSEALECALKTDSLDSVTVTYARFSLGEQLVKHNQLSRALEVR